MASPVSATEIYHPAVQVAGVRLLTPSLDGRGQGAILHAGTARWFIHQPRSSGDHLEIY